MERTETIEYFRNKFNAEVDKDFWNTGFDGEAPVDYARDRALEECINIKIQQILAQEYGLIDNITYGAFLKDLLAENKRRNEAVRMHQVIYGPVQYNENDYFIHVLSNLAIKIKDRLLEGKLKPTEAQLREYYEEVKDKLYKKEDSIKLNVLFISYSKEDGSFTEIEKKEATDRMKEIKADIDKGKSFEEIAKGDPEKIKLDEKIINANSASSYSKTEPKLFETAKSLKSGQISDILDEPVQKRVEIVKVLFKEGTGYKPFEEFKDSILSGYIDLKYGEMVQKLVKEAKVEINGNIYRKTFPE